MRRPPRLWCGRPGATVGVHDLDQLRVHMITRTREEGALVLGRDRSQIDRVLVAVRVEDVARHGEPLQLLRGRKVREEDTRRTKTKAKQKEGAEKVEGVLMILTKIGTPLQRMKRMKTRSRRGNADVKAVPLPKNDHEAKAGLAG